MDDLALITVRQLEVAVRIWHPEAPRTVVAWHGLARHGGDFDALARELGPTWRLLAPDAPGRGLSSWSLFPAQDYLYSHYMDVAIGVLDHFELERVAWVGTSMGGLLGMLLAASDTHAPRIERLVINDVGPELERDGLRDLSRYFSVPHRFATFTALADELREHYAGFGIDSEAAWRRLALESARRLPDGSWTFHYDPRIAEQFVHDTPRDLWADWGKIRCPLMVIRGEQSPLLSRAVVERMKREQPDLSSIEAKGCGHAPMLDRPAQVTPLKAFLELSHGAPRHGQEPTGWQRPWAWLRRALLQR
ncbi:alpha/beta fold hydrolase [Litchfieldella xinjiangensis]|uniref:alpha/beta fold hydrolase n=1 Tax=Litchfieldella xinjiangensis TaxID=1166948 RepID=UPI0005B93344|nr:alpha/beta hydrolase [Halomonas xinjiangensis]